MKMTQKRNAVGRDDFELLSEKEKKGKLIHSWLPWGLHIIQTKTTEGFIGNWNREIPSSNLQLWKSLSYTWKITVKKTTVKLCTECNNASYQQNAHIVLRDNTVDLV